jgi:methyl coenzyme M reductase subunit C-like uncharacterized protein (methanogenesis marker protein 7)
MTQDEYDEMTKKEYGEIRRMTLGGVEYVAKVDSNRSHPCESCDLDEYCHPVKDNMQYICALTISADIYFKRAEGK